MLPEILKRRSIRKYKSQQIPHQAVTEILEAGCLAPSAKNRQPWRFVVVSGDSKNDMIDALKSGLEREKQPGLSLLPDSACYLSGAENTLKIIEQAPVIIFVINTLGIDLNQCIGAEGRVSEICNAQSIGAAMQNMSLTAVELGLGSLWICDIYFAYSELKRWLNTSGEPIAAMALGYADEAPLPRPRKNQAEITEWRI